MCSLGCIWPIKMDLCTFSWFLGRGIYSIVWTRSKSKMGFRSLVFKGLSIWKATKILTSILWKHIVSPNMSQNQMLKESCFATAPNLQVENWCGTNSSKFLESRWRWFWFSTAKISYVPLELICLQHYHCFQSLERLRELLAVSMGPLLCHDAPWLGGQFSSGSYHS